MLQKTTPLETFTVGGRAYTINVAAVDSTNDATTNYDTLVFFDATDGILPGPFTPPATGPAYVTASDKRSSLFYLEGSSSKAGTAFYVSFLAPDLSTVRLARLSANAMPRNPAVLADVDDINTNVGFWAPQADFRIPERLSPGFATFPDVELEDIYEDLVRGFVEYQTRVGLRGIAKFPDADLVMIYLEQPDGSGHQFLLTDPRQPTNPQDPASIGAGQDPAKIARYRGYLQRAYQVANGAVQRIIDAVGITPDGRPASNLFVVSDHGFAPFHTAVNMTALLASRGIDSAKVRAYTSGPAANISINLAGRERNGTVTPAEYVTLQQQVVQALADLKDTNPTYTNGAPGVPVFDKIHARPLPANLADPAFGRGTSDVIGQDSGDVFALLALGYNFDGIQGTGIVRQGDAVATTPILSVPNFYGAHGYDPALPEMSAVFYVAGPDIRAGRLTRARNIDVAPTIARLLDVPPAPVVDGRALPVRIGRKVKSDLVTRLTALLPTGTDRTDKALEKAIDRLRGALDDRFWLDDATLGDKGAQVFNEDAAVLRELIKAGPTTLPLQQALVAIDEELAAAAVDEAAGGNGDARLIARAQDEVSKASADVAAGSLERALDHYRRAWEHAQRARGRAS